MHYVDEAGQLYTYGALASQLDLWARRFDRVWFCGCLGSGPPPPGFEAYRHANVELVAIPQAGGTGLKAKLTVLRSFAKWFGIMVPVLRSSDAVHLRAPCNVTILGILLSPLLVKNRYAIFAGSWHPYDGEPVSYRAQRWLLRWWFGGVVHAYIPVDEVPDRPNVRQGFSPVVTIHQLRKLSAKAKSARSGYLYPRLGRPIRLVCVGRFSINKNQILIINALREFRQAGFKAECHFIGAGDQLSAVMQAAEGLEGVRFTPHATRDEVFHIMTWADLNILPSFREGFPKVLLEGMSTGALPVASSTPMNEAMTESRGWVFDPRDPSDLARVLVAAVALSRREWDERRVQCASFATAHTLDAFEAEVDHIVSQIWRIDPVEGVSKAKWNGINDE